VATFHTPALQAERTELVEAGLKALAAPVQEPTCKQSLQVWVISNGKGAGQFSWDPQDERFWTRMESAAPPAQPAPVQECFWRREGYKECPAAQRQWVGLTDEEIDKTRFAIQTKAITQRDHELSRAIEAKLKEKNTP
jgi:hypothetical protein